MKKFALICDSEHEFDGWFKDAEAVKSQAASGLIDCPYCGSIKVHKQLSAPNLSTPKTKARIKDAPVPSDIQKQVSDTKGPQINPPSGAMMAGQNEKAGAAALAYNTALQAAMRQLRKTIETEFKNVGADFAEEARKIHYGESEQENIYGTCSKQETEELIEEGIEILPLPLLPPEH